MEIPIRRNRFDSIQWFANECYKRNADPCSNEKEDIDKIKLITKRMHEINNSIKPEYRSEFLIQKQTEN